MAVIAVYTSGEGCDGVTEDLINQFVADNNLQKVKLDLRSFRFDCLEDKLEIGRNSYWCEIWYICSTCIRNLGLIRLAITGRPS